MTENTLKLEVGKRYVRLDGEVTAPLEPNDDSTYPFWDRANGATYTSTGLWHINALGCNGLNDLVAEYLEQTEAAPQKTLRDEFAMAALSALILKHSLLRDDTAAQQGVAEAAYRLADAMLEAREERS